MRGCDITPGCVGLYGHGGDCYVPEPDVMPEEQRKKKFGETRSYPGMSGFPVDLAKDGTIKQLSEILDEDVPEERPVDPITRMRNLWQANIIRNIRAIGTALRRLAEDIDREAEKLADGKQDNLQAIGNTVHTLAWGTANLNLSALIAAQREIQLIEEHENKNSKEQ